MSTHKNWNRPWSPDEIIENAENWSLAGDVALLNTIKQFANNLLTKTDNLNRNINDLLNDLNEVGLQLDLSQNEFQSLKNTQFIESRVYDDDETLDSNENEKVLEQNAKQPEEETHFDVNLNLEVKLLDKYFETVEISISDSEDESEKSFILKPIDVYTDRPLPPLIGSDEWYTNWYLEDEFNDTDSQKSEDVYSDSDSDNNLPKDLMFTSETSSEIYFSHSTTTENKHVDNSSIKNVIKNSESSASSEGSSFIPTKAVISNKTFAEQLTAKLDNVISKEEKISEQINSKPIQPIKNNTFLGLFADEPPPLSDSEDKATKGIFSGGKNLFDEDDDDEDSLFGDNVKKVFLPQNTSENKNDISTNNNFLPQSSQVSKGLFDSDNSDDEIVSRNKNKPNTFLQYNKPIVPLINEEPPALEVETSIKKKPVGGVSVFGKENINELIKKKQKNISENQEKKSLENDKKISNLFKDNDEDIFTEIDTKKTNLCDDDLNVKNDDKSETLQKKKISLFDDDDESEKEDDLFCAPKKIVENKLDLFDDALFTDINDNKTSSNIKNLSDKDDHIFDKPTEEIVKDKQPSVKSKLTSLFDDNEEEEDEDDIFANVTKKIDFELFKEPESSEDLFNIKKEIKTENIIKIAQVENTGDYMRNKFDKSGDEEKNNTNIIKREDYSKSQQIEEDDSKNSSVLEEDDNMKKELLDDNVAEGNLFGTQEKFDYMNDSFNDVKKAETSTKPPIAQKPHSNTNKETVSVSKQISDSQPDIVPILQTLTTPTSNIISDSKSCVPVVDLFSSTPPPDDYEWDNKSDTFSDTEDILGYGIDKNNRITSSLFDNEPPSLNEDDTSGIVRDSSNTRIDTDDSSIDPQDSFNEQQNRDGFFVANQSDISEESKVITETLDELNNEVENEELLENKETSSRKIASITEMLKNQNQKESNENRTSPGKLKQNLKINVEALLPGYSQQKIGTLIKSPSLDDDINSIENEDVVSKKPESELPTGFDATDRVEILPSITKGRVRIPIKRRPSSRRGRQEAIRKSTFDEFSQASEELESAIQEDTNSTETNDLVEKEDVSTKTNDIKSTSESNNIHWLPEEIKNEEIKQDTKKYLFGSGSESEEDLFGGRKNKKEIGKKRNVKKSLFDDSSSDDDDLFLGRKSDKTTVNVKKVLPTIKKLENVETEEDPLSNLLK